MALIANTLYPQHIALTAYTAAEWSASNPILLRGELGIESDTSRIKIGNGSTNWSSLPYIDTDIITQINAITSRLDALEALMTQHQQLADSLHDYFNSLAAKTYREETDE